MFVFHRSMQITTIDFSFSISTLQLFSLFSKKSGKTGRHYPPHQNQVLPKVPNSPTLNSQYHTVMAGGMNFQEGNGPSVRSVQTGNNLRYIKSTSYPKS